MATGTITISDAVGSTAMTGFTKRNLASATAFSVVADTSVPGGKAITHDGSDQRNGGLTVDAAGQAADTEILALVYANTQPADFNIKGGLLIRAQDFTTGSHDMIVGGIETRTGGDDRLTIRKKVAGTQSGVTSFVFAWATATWYAVRLRITGTSVQGKVWQPANLFAPTGDEPGSWSVSGTISDVTGAGWVGFAQVDANTVIERWVPLGWATGGDTAPVPVFTSTVRPASTISAGAWTAVGAATLHEATDDTAADYVDYARSPDDPVNAVAVVRFGAFTQPPVAPADGELVLPVTWGIQGPGLASLTVALWQPYSAGAGTLIASTAEASGVLSLSAAEAAAITYTSGSAADLDLVLTANLTT